MKLFDTRYTAAGVKAVALRRASGAACTLTVPTGTSTDPRAGTATRASVSKSSKAVLNIATPESNETKASKAPDLAHQSGLCKSSHQITNLNQAKSNQAKTQISKSKSGQINHGKSPNLQIKSSKSHRIKSPNQQIKITPNHKSENLNHPPHIKSYLI